MLAKGTEAVCCLFLLFCSVFLYQLSNFYDIMVPFQCDLCHFCNIVNCDLWVMTPFDKEIVEYIRRANLDPFWSRESSTRRGILRLALKAETNNDKFGMPPLIGSHGPFPALNDMCGMKSAIAIMIWSL